MRLRKIEMHRRQYSPLITVLKVFGIQISIFREHSRIGAKLLVHFFAVIRQVGRGFFALSKGCPAAPFLIPNPTPTGYDYQNERFNPAPDDLYKRLLRG